MKELNAMNGTSEIRPISEADFDAWIPLWKGYQAFYNVEIAEDVTRTTWARMLDPAEPVHAALIWLDERAIGLVHWIFHRSTWTTGDYCYLQDLFVGTDVRGGGHGRKLIEHVYAQARAAQASRVYWLTHESNTVARRLYDRVADQAGFIQYRKTP